MAITPNTNKLDFHNIKSELKEYLKSQDKLKDYNFEGSVINSVLDVLAYTTHYNAFNANMAVNESFLDTSQLRSSAVSHAKLLGYTPRSYTSATVRVDISGGSQNSILSRGDVFISNTAAALDFIVQEDVLSTDTNYLDVKLTQGKLVEDEYRYNINDNEIYYLSNKNADTSTLVVTVSKPNSTAEESFVPIKSVSDILDTKNLYWLQENKNGLYSVYFGDGIIGKTLDNNDIIKLSYIAGTVPNNDPTEANNISTLLHDEGVYTVNMLGLQTESGSPRESIESIKFNSPLSYSAQNRAVTISDYEAIIRSEISDIKSLNVWGGETEIPPTPGIVYTSIITNDSDDQIDINVKNHVISHIKKKNVLGIDVVIKDYTKLNLHLDISYSYSPSAINNVVDINTKIRSAITSYNDDILNSFSGVFRKSNVLNIIDSVDHDVLSSSVKVKLSKDVNVISLMNNLLPYNIEKNDEIDGSESLEYDKIENNRPLTWSFNIVFAKRLNDIANNSSILWTSDFIYKGINCQFKDLYNPHNSVREINIVQAIDNKRMVAEKVGYVDSVNGLLIINALDSSKSDLVDSFSEGFITFTVLPYGNDIYPKFNHILQIPESNIDIKHTLRN
jgi:molybdopterin-binding protein